MCGLSWDDVDLDGACLVVAWQITGISYKKARDAEKEGLPAEYRVRPKTRDGEERTVDLDDITVLVLRHWRKRQAEERLALGPAYRNTENLVFTRADGTPLAPNYVTATFDRLVRRAGLRKVPLHHLRHGSASL